MPTPANYFNSKKASEAGKKSKRGVSFKRALIEMFQKEAKKGGKLTEETFVKACTLAAMKGNAGMARMIFEYIDGKVPDNINIDNKQEFIIVTPEEKAMMEKKKDN